MGYTTDFTGSFKLSKPLTPEQVAYLRKFTATRRMRRHVHLHDSMAGLPIGDECAYYVGSEEMFGQDQGPAIIDTNNPPPGQPDVWCPWVPSMDGAAIESDGGERAYRYDEWANYLLDHFLSPWGIAFASSDVKYEGEDRDDFGKLVIDETGHVKQVPGKRSWGDE